MLEQEEPGELEPEDDSEDSVTAGVAALVLQAQLIEKRHLEHNQPQEAGLKGCPWLLNYIMHHLYPDKTESIRKTKLAEAQGADSTRFLRLCDGGADSLQLSLPEREESPSIMTHPSLRQQLQSSHCLGVG